MLPKRAAFENVDVTAKLVELGLGGMPTQVHPQSNAVRVGFVACNTCLVAHSSTVQWFGLSGARTGRKDPRVEKSGGSEALCSRGTEEVSRCLSYSLEREARARIALLSQVPAHLLPAEGCSSGPREGTRRRAGSGWLVPLCA